MLMPMEYQVTVTNNLFGNHVYSFTFMITFVPCFADFFLLYGNNFSNCTYMCIYMQC